MYSSKCRSPFPLPLRTPSLCRCNIPNQCHLVFLNAKLINPTGYTMKEITTFSPHMDLVALFVILPGFFQHLVNASLLQSALLAISFISWFLSVYWLTVKHCLYSLNRGAHSSVVPFPRRYSVNRSEGCHRTRMQEANSKHTLAVPLQETRIITSREQLDPHLS